jgi:hypothetical protein
MAIVEVSDGSLSSHDCFDLAADLHIIKLVRSPPPESSRAAERFIAKQGRLNMTRIYFDCSNTRELLKEVANVLRCRSLREREAAWAGLHLRLDE